MSSLHPLLKPLALPLRFMPVAVHSRALALVLNQVMKEAIADGELDFLRDRRVGIEVDDLGVRYRLGLSDGKFRGYGEEAAAESLIAGNLHTLLLLAARREDADTLFFQRRLRICGDTELGLYLKNFLDAFEPPPRLAPLVRALERLADLGLAGAQSTRKPDD